MSFFARISSPSEGFPDTRMYELQNIDGRLVRTWALLFGLRRLFWGLAVIGFGVPGLIVALYGLRSLQAGLERNSSL